MQILLSKTMIVALLMIGAISSISFGYFHDQSIKGVYNSLTPTIYNDQDQISADRSQIADQQSQITQLQNRLNAQGSGIATLEDIISRLQENQSNLGSQVSQLQSPKVDGWFTFTGATCYYGCSVNGAVANYGTQDAKDIVATLTWKNNGAFVQTNTINIGNLAGRSLQLYPLGSSSQYFSLSAPANQLSWSFTWTT